MIGTVWVRDRIDTSTAHAFDDAGETARCGLHLPAGEGVQPSTDWPRCGVCLERSAPPNGAARAIITAFVTWLGDHDYSITRQFNDGSASFPDLDDIIDSFLPPTTEGTPT